MSDGKSKIKGDVFRKHFANAIELVPAAHAGELRYAPLMRKVSAVVEDASVRLSTFTNTKFGPIDAQSHGLIDLNKTWQNVVDHFLESVRYVFETPGSDVMTYVLVFDKPSFVPDAKAGTRAKRAEAFARQQEMWRVDTLPWWQAAITDATARTTERKRIISSLSDKAYPWPYVMATRALRNGLIHEICTLIGAIYQPPPGKRLILDWQSPDDHPAASRISVVGDGTSSDDMQGIDVALANTCGEADMACQHYVLQLMRMPDLCKHDILLYSTDSDFLTLSLMTAARWFSLQPIEGMRERFVYVTMGGVSIQGNPADRVYVSKTYGTGGENGPRPYTEVFVVNTACERILKLMNRGATECSQAILSFATFCMACGNDYIANPYGIGHQTMANAFFAMCTESGEHYTPLATQHGIDGILLNVGAYATYMRWCYYQALITARTKPEHMPPKPPVACSYGEISSYVVRKWADARRHMPVRDALDANYRRLFWAVQYGWFGPFGHTRVPNCALYGYPPSAPRPAIVPAVVEADDMYDGL